MKVNVRNEVNYLSSHQQLRSDPPPHLPEQEPFAKHNGFISLSNQEILTVVVSSAGVVVSPSAISVVASIDSRSVDDSGPSHL